MINKFSENLKMLRMEAGLLQKELAEKLGTARRNISFWEAKGVEPDFDTLIRIAKFFDVRTDYLLGLED